MTSARPLVIAVGLMPLSARARTAVREAIRLDAIEAPRREAVQRKKEAGEASAARDKTRIANKAAFRP